MEKKGCKHEKTKNVNEVECAGMIGEYQEECCDCGVTVYEYSYGAERYLSEEKD